MSSNLPHRWARDSTGDHHEPDKLGCGFVWLRDVETNHGPVIWSFTRRPTPNIPVGSTMAVLSCWTSFVSWYMRRSLLRDSTNCPLLQASEAKNRDTTGRANSLTTRTPKRAKTITWADVARGNSTENPTRPIKARSARTQPLMQHGGDQCRWTWMAGRPPN